jgi:hypothetical protein
MAIVCPSEDEDGPCEEIRYGELLLSATQRGLIFDKYRCRAGHLGA